MAFFSMRGQTVDRGRDETDSICCLHGAIAKRPAQAEDSTDVAIYCTAPSRSIYFSVPGGAR